MEDSVKLWKEFNLGEQNPDQGGCVLYCLRYSPEKIEAQHGQIVSALESLDIELEPIENFIGAKAKRELNDSEKRRTSALFEELSVLNGAREYSQMGFDKFKNIEDLKNGLILHYMNNLTDRNLPDAYNLADMIAPEIVRDVHCAEMQNNVLSKSDKIALRDLSSFMESQVNLHNSPGGFVIFGAKD